MQARKAHSLISRVYDLRNLRRAWEKVKENQGSAGVDGITIARFDEKREHYLEVLRRRLQDGSYRPRPVKRVEIEKPGSTAKRPSGFPPLWTECANRRWSKCWNRSWSRRLWTQALAFGHGARHIRPCGASGGTCSRPSG